MAKHIEIAGKWYNQHGSEIELATYGAGRIRGTFRSGVGVPDPEEEFEVVGVVNGELVGFVVSFGKYDSVTSWTGHVGIHDGQETLHCLWQMSVGLPPGHEEQLWQGTWAGADVFQREQPTGALQRGRFKPSHPVEGR
jgi:hypothetical protein